MSGRLGQLLPTAIVLAALGYLCWPYYDDAPSAAEEKKENKLPVISSGLLSPPREPAPERDPFKQPGAPKLAKAAKPKQETTLRKVTAEASAGSHVLHATHIRGRSRLALINDRVYSEGEQLKSTSTSAGPVTVVRIYPDHVTLKSEATTWDLKYPSAAARPATGPAGKGTPSVRPVAEAPAVATKSKPDKAG